MNNKKNYTAKQLNDAEKLAKFLSSVPKEKREMAVLMANSFIAGMESQRFGMRNDTR